MNTNDEQTQRMDEKDSDFTIDHEEHLDASTFISDVIEAKTVNCCQSDSLSSIIFTKMSTLHEYQMCWYM